MWRANRCFPTLQRSSPSERRTESLLYLCHFWWLDLLDLEEIAQGKESYCHGADTDHKHHQGGPAADVQLQVLQGVDVEHYSDQLHLKGIHPESLTDSLKENLRLTCFFIGVGGVRRSHVIELENCLIINPFKKTRRGKKTNRKY